mmetsp:Transcript_67295/g.111428  ORF Transcript_67295/g.111428 Transcript_67295/m.111428 type:complete len:482 (+) Transcript_67295:98-1543(+)
MKLPVIALVVLTRLAVSAALLHDDHHGKGLFLSGKTVSLNRTLLPPEGAPLAPLNSISLEEMRVRGHRLVGLLMVTVFLAYLALFAMARSGNKVMMKNAWGAFDSTNVTIIGVTLFSVITDVIQNFEELGAYLNKDGTVSPTLMAVFNVSLYGTYSTAVFVGAIFGAYKFKDSPKNLAIFNAVIYWVVILAKGGAINQAQLQLGVLSNGTQCPLRTSMWTIFGLFCVSLLVVGVHHVKPRPRWWDATENAVVGGSAAAAICQLVSLLIDIALSKVHGEVPVWEKTSFNNVFGLVSVFILVVGNSPLSQMQKKYEGAEPHEHAKYWKGRCFEILVSFVGVLPYFAITNSLGNSISTYLGVDASTAIAKIINTMANSALGISCVLICTFVPYFQSGTDHAEQLSQFLQGFGGYVAGYTWSTLITTAGAAILDKSIFQPGTNPMLIDCSQTAFCWFLLLVHLPVYLFYIKPVIDEKVSELTKDK